MKLGIGIDTGGTYTDAVIYDFDASRVVASTKAPTTHENLELGIGAALDSLPRELTGRAELLSLSTTLATNACVENKGGRAKLVLVGTTERTLEWVDAYKTYGFSRDEVRAIDNKSSFDGKQTEVPDWDAFLAANADWLSDAAALAAAENNAIHNGAPCERALGDKLAGRYNIPYIAASELSGELNMMERGATALLNAKLLPVIDEFLSAINRALRARGLNIRRMIVRSDGSLMNESAARSQPVKTILSGPAASVIGAGKLAGRADSIIVDMGGTTTDISIVENSRPAMTDGIRIGGKRTQIKGVFIDTFGLGGDSRIIADESKPIITGRRVLPLSAAAVRFPRVIDELEELLSTNKRGTSPLYEFLYLVRTPANTSGYTESELELIDALKGDPVMLGSGKIDYYRLKSERLEQEGIVMRIGLTPTDIMHIKGDFDAYDRRAALLGVRWWLRALDGYDDCDEDVARFADKIYDLVKKKLYTNIVRIMLSYRYPKLFDGASDGLLRLIESSWDDRNQKGLFDTAFASSAALVGIGAPTHIFLPDVAAALSAECVIPPDAGVANAVGAVTADISAEVKLTITPNLSAEGVEGYTLYLPDGSHDFEKLSDAVERAEREARELAIAEARRHGAPGELAVTVDVGARSALDRRGSTVELDTTIVARAAAEV